MKPLRSFLFVPIASLLFFAVNLFAVHLLLRGHDAPGGGFIAGVGTALTFILLGLAHGAESLQRFVRVDPVRLAVLGVTLAAGVATAPLLWGEPLLTHHTFELPSVPLAGEVSLSTTLVFDTGVYLLVVGALLKMLLVLARSIARLGPFAPGEEAGYASPVEQPIEPAHHPQRRRPRRAPR